MAARVYDLDAARARRSQERLESPVPFRFPIRVKPLQHYILDADRNVVVARDVIEWGRFFENIDARRVALDGTPEVSVSTVFLGIDHNFGHHGPPLLFETMIFGGPHDEYQDRAATWAEAEEQHAEACRLAGVVAKPARA